MKMTMQPPPRKVGRFQKEYKIVFFRFMSKVESVRLCHVNDIGIKFDRSYLLLKHWLTDFNAIALPID